MLTILFLTTITTTTTTVQVTGSVPPGTGSGIDYTDTLPRQTPTNINADIAFGETGPLGSSGAAFDNIISGNDDPDNVFSQPFVAPADLLSKQSDLIQGGVDTSGMPGILTSLGNMVVSPAGGQTILGRSRNKALAASGDLDGINPQGPTYTPTEEPSFLDNVLSTAGRAGDYVYNAINPLSPTDSFTGGDAALSNLRQG